jgi:hypothetical protein
VARTRVQSRRRVTHPDTAPVLDHHSPYPSLVPGKY